MELFIVYVRNLFAVFFHSRLAMFSRFRNALFNVVGGLEPLPVLKDAEASLDESSAGTKYAYCRPEFLLFNREEEIQVSADHKVRPIIVPRDLTILPWNSGYAEVVNAGKSVWNEDQAAFFQGVLDRGDEASESSKEECSLPYYYFGIFDGHAGVGAAIAASKQLHHILHLKLKELIDHLLPPFEGFVPVEKTTTRGVSFFIPEKEVPTENLIIGALESAFHEMDHQIGEDKKRCTVKGGCTALVALFILGKLFVANAGDSRAVLCISRQPVPVSKDFTPETERQRIRQLAYLKPELLGEEFTHLDFLRRPSQKDVGRKMLYRDAYMTGWAYKNIAPDDLKIPVVFGEGKRSRVMATIGVTRGFGDHELKALNTSASVKPFLSSQPQVKVLDLLDEEIKDCDVLIMGTDGLWDVTTNEKAVEIIQRSLDQFSANDRSLKYRYTSAAQDLVNYARGKLVEQHWKTVDGRPATADDVSVFIIPLVTYQEQFSKWKAEYESLKGIYEVSEFGKNYGQLFLKSSPLASDKLAAGSSAASTSVPKQHKEEAKKTRKDQRTVTSHKHEEEDPEVSKKKTHRD